jgi:signal transduction histidine kinase
MREQLLYNVAHELRAPLSALEGVLEVLHSSWHELPAQEIGRLISSARRTSGRLRILTEDLLNAGSIQAGRFIVAPRDVSLRPIIDEAIEATIPHFEALEQAVELVMPEAEVGVHADPRYTSQVLVNLLLNASKYSPPQDRVVIVVQCEPERLRLTVEDHGKGIPPQQLEGLFQRFYRGGEQGFGLGLAIARNIIEAQGGEMGIDSEVGQGTRVWLTLRKSELREDPAG